MWTSQRWKFNHPYTWVNSGGLGTMGFAVPAAIGAKVGKPERMVWAVDGDGCFQMTAQELVTASAERIPVKIAILNNAYLGMVRQWQELFYEERYSEVYLSPDLPDYVKWAEAMGCVGFRVDTPEDVVPTIEKANEIDDRPVVIDFRTDYREKVYPMVAAGTSNDDVILDPAHDRPGEVTDHGNEMRGSTTSSACSSRTSSACSSRVAGLFARRGFNIFSLAVSPTEDERFSRMTIVVDADSAPLEQITKQLNKLIPVIKIAELHPDEAVERELMLVTVKATAELRSQITELASIFQAQIDDVGHDALTIQVAGAPEKLDAMTDLLAAVRHRRAPAHRPDRPAQAGPPPGQAPCGQEPRPSDRLLRRTHNDQEELLMPATIYYDDDADLGAARGTQGRGPRLRLAGPRARAEPEGLGRRRARRPPRGLVVVGQGRGGRAARCSPTAEACQGSRRDHGAAARHRAGARLRGRHRAQPRASATRSRSRTGSTSTSARSRRPRASTCG